MRSKPTAIRTCGTARYALPLFICFVCYLGFCPASFAQIGMCSPSTPYQVSKTGKANHEVSLTGYGSLDYRDCSVREPPAIDLDLPPSHGTVCLRRIDYQIKAVCTNRSVHCIGQQTTGVSVVYLPRHAYTGSDALRYKAHLPTGTVTINVSLTVEPDDPPSPGVVPADINAPAGDAPQSPGPIPKCAPLMS